MIRHGDTVINFNKVKGTQLADIRTVIRKRPTTKFSTGLSLEAQEAMHQVVEEAKLEQMARRGKRGSRGNVLFSDTVQIRRGSTTRTLGFFDMLKDNNSPTTAQWSKNQEGGGDRNSGGVSSREEMLIRSSRNVSVSTSSNGRPGSLSLAVDQVEMANRPGGMVRERKTSRNEDGKKEGKRKR